MDFEQLIPLLTLCDFCCKVLEQV